MKQATPRPHTGKVRVGCPCPDGKPACRGGVLIFLLVILILFFGILASLPMLVAGQTSASHRALALAERRLERRVAAKQAVTAALQDHLEVLDRAPFPGLLDAYLELLSPACGAVSRPVVQGELKPMNWLPVFDARDVLRRADEDLRLRFPRLGLNARTRVENLGALSVYLRLAGEEGLPDEPLNYQLRVVGVPLCEDSGILYHLPSEIGDYDPVVPSAGGAKGSLPGTDSTGVPTLFRSGSLPFHYRSEVARGATFARLFGAQGVGLLTAAAGKDGLVVLGGSAADAPGTDNPALSSGENSVDVDMAGPALPGVLVISARAPGARVRLWESSGAAQLPALLVLVIGRKGGAARLELDDCTRPVLVLGSHVEVHAREGLTWAGGLVLGPGSGLLPGARGLVFGHFACHAAARPGDGALAALTGVGDALAAVYPKTYYGLAAEARP